jgi:rhamnogalacturonan endolyase
MNVKILFAFLLISVSCESQKKPVADFPYVPGRMIYEDTFDQPDTSQWIVEAEEEFSFPDHVVGGSLDIDASKGITIWNKQKFHGNVMFEFEVTVIKKGGRNDRVSDLNCFWMATDPEFPDNFFSRSSTRKGIFWNYYPLKLYYVGYGGHQNTKSRFRKYNGATAPLPAVLHEYSDSSHLITPNVKMVVDVVSFDSTVAYFINRKKIFELKDKQPYREGYFGFRTLDNHMIVENFKVYALRSAN